MLKRKSVRWAAAPVALVSLGALCLSSTPASAATYGPLKNVHDSSMCLTNDGSTANSAPITQYTCNGSTNQGWEVLAVSFEGILAYQIINQHSGDCLTNGGSNVNSAPITQYPCASLSSLDTNQIWEYSGSYPSRFVDGNGKCLTDGGSTANNAPITQYTCNNTTNQKWNN